MLKKIAVIGIIIITLGLFGYYIYKNPDLMTTLVSLSPATIILLTVGYILVIAVNAATLHWSLHFIGHRLKFMENMLLTGYSSIANFFGPLQSGPGVRAVYLKKKHRVQIKDFSITLLVFYSFFAVINASVILIAVSLENLISPLITWGIIAIITITAFCMLHFSSRLRQMVRKIKLTSINFWLIGLGAFGLTAVTAAIYYVELNHVSSIPFWPVTIYTAAANLSLFVSLTPGAIGFRESFIFLTQQLHGIDTASIVSANIIDRAFYIIFLLGLFILLLAINSRHKLAIFSAHRVNQVVDSSGETIDRK